MKNLSKLLSRLAKNNTIIISFANYNYLPVIENWIHAIERLKITNYLIISLDEKLYEELRKRNVATILRACPTELGSLWIHRIDIIQEILIANYNVLHSDADAIWLRNPLEKYIYPQCHDMVFSQGTVWPPDVYKKWGFVLCCGFFYVKSNQPVLDFFDKLSARVRLDKDDQISVNRLLLEHGIRWELPSCYWLPFKETKYACFKEVVNGRANNLTVALLPHEKFQRLKECHDDVFVKHILSQKNAEDIMDTAKENDCLLTNDDIQ